MKPIVIATILSLLVHSILLLNFTEKYDIVVKEELVLNIVDNENEYVGDDWGMREAIKEADEMYPCLKRRKEK